MNIFRILRSLPIALVATIASVASAAQVNTWQVPADASNTSASGMTLALGSYTQTYFTTDYPAFSLILKPRNYPDPSSAWGLKWYPILYGNASLPMPYLFYLGDNVDLSGGNVFRLSVVNGTTGPSNTEAHFDTVDITVVPSSSSTTGSATATMSLAPSSAGAASSTTATSGSSSSSNNQQNSSSNSGTNSTAIGAGVGVGVGVPLILAVVGLAIFLRKRKRSQHAAATAAGAPNTSQSPSKPSSGVQEKRGNELQSRPVEELPAYTEMGNNTLRTELP